MPNNPYPSTSFWLPLDKPEGVSSNGAMARVRRILERIAATGSGDSGSNSNERRGNFSSGTSAASPRSVIRAGYIGTLDPFATGVLPIAIGEARKFIPYVSEERKTYVFSVVFGSETDSLDVDGDVVATSDRLPLLSDLQSVLPQFLGDQQQMPPKFSAIKINGRRACDLMRQGKDEEVKLQLRSVHIFSLKLLDFTTAGSEVAATIEVVCSKGTYVRSLARDIAHALGTLAFVKTLRRTSAGPFDISRAISLEKLQQIEDTRQLMDFVMPLESPLDDIPALYLSAEESMRLQNGLIVFPENGPETFDSSDGKSAESVDVDNVRIFEKPGGIFRGIGALLSNGSVKAVRMLSPKCC